MLKEIKPDTSILNRLETVRKNANAEEFVKKKKADKAATGAGKLERKQNKTQEDMARARELVEQAKEYREEAAAAAEMKKKSSLASTIIKGYFAYKFAKLLLSPVYNGYAYGGMGMGAAQMGGIMTDAMTNGHFNENGELVNPWGSEERAQAIEQTQQICEEVSQEAMDKGLIDEPVLSDDDKQRMDELAEICRDDKDPEQLDKYAAKCQELGLDYNEARDAFSKDLTIGNVENNVEHERDDLRNDIAGMELSI